MKANKILAGLLILLGFGSCANRAAKSKSANGAGEQGQTEIKTETDSIAPIRVMYGPPRPGIRAEPRIRPVRPADTTSGTTADTISGTTDGSTPAQE